MTQRYAGMLRRHAGEWDKVDMPVQAECCRQAARHMENRERELLDELASLRKDLADMEASREDSDAAMFRAIEDALRFRWLQEHTVATGLSRWMGSTQFLAAAVDDAMHAEVNSASA